MRPARLDFHSFDWPIAVRLMAECEVTNTGCWEWTGFRNEYGYGVIRINGRSGWLERCHRISYALFVGPIEHGDCVLHRCDNPPCCNYDHLFVGTKADNTDDMMAKGRWRQPAVHRGEDGTNAKLKDADVLVIIERLLRGDTRTQIGADFSVTVSAISRIAVGKNWKHLTVGRGIVKSTRGIKRV